MLLYVDSYLRFTLGRYVYVRKVYVYVRKVYVYVRKVYVRKEAYSARDVMRIYFTVKVIA